MGSVNYSRSKYILLQQVLIGKNTSRELNCNWLNEHCCTENDIKRRLMTGLVAVRSKALDCGRLVFYFVSSSPAICMDVICCCFDCCVLSGRGLCDSQVTSSEQSYRLKCVVVGHSLISRIRRYWPLLRRRATGKKLRNGSVTELKYNNVECSKYYFE